MARKTTANHDAYYLDLRVRLSVGCKRRSYFFFLYLPVFSYLLWIKDLMDIVTIKQDLEVRSAVSIENGAVWNTVNFLAKVSLYGWQIREIKRRLNILRR